MYRKDTSGGRALYILKQHKVDSAAGTQPCASGSHQPKPGLAAPIPRHLDVSREHSGFPAVVVAAIFALVFFPCAAQAGVTLRNGNFSLGWTDISYDGGMGLEIKRVYNSKANFKGMFGAGWGSEFESYLEFPTDGGVILHESGGGAEIRFTQSSDGPRSISAMVDQIVSVARAQQGATDARDWVEYRKRLTKENSFRAGEWSRFLKMKMLLPLPLQNGSRLVSSKFGSQSLTVAADGFIREYADGKSQLFSKDGKLLRTSDRNGHFWLLQATTAKNIVIRDDLDRTLSLDLDANGLVHWVRGSKGEVVLYGYNPRQELVFSKDANDGVVGYEYESTGTHNLTQIKYANGTTKTITYYPPEKDGNVSSVIDQEGMLTEYQYGKDVRDPNLLRVVVSDSSAADQAGSRKKIGVSSFEFVSSRDENGEEYLARQIEDRDGKRRVTNFDESGNPLKIEQDRPEASFSYDTAASFSYDALGRVTRKVTHDEITELSYDPRCGKVASVIRKDAHTGELRFSGNYIYDARGNLLTATDGATTVKLSYDAKNRMSGLQDSSGNLVVFEYNSEDKPVRVSVSALPAADGKGATPRSVDFSYDADGSWNVNSPDGPAASLTVMELFTKLLDLIRPAGAVLPM